MGEWADVDGPFVGVVWVYVRGAVGGCDGCCEGAVYWGVVSVGVGLVGGGEDEDGGEDVGEEDELNGRWTWTPLTLFLASLLYGMLKNDDDAWELWMNELVCFEVQWKECGTIIALG